MWIRSQEGKIMMDATYIDVVGRFGKFEIHASNASGTALLGQYHKEERAMKVMDEIESAIVTTFGQEVANDGRFFPNVYRMLRDKEVSENNVAATR